jgi:hypothetical protein
MNTTDNATVNATTDAVLCPRVNVGCDHTMMMNEQGHGVACMGYSGPAYVAPTYGVDYDNERKSWGVMIIDTRVFVGHTSTRQGARVMRRHMEAELSA